MITFSEARLVLQFIFFFWFLMIGLMQGLFGYVCDSGAILAPLEKYVEEREAAAPTTWNGSMDVQTLKSLYTKGIITPEDVVNEVYRRLKLPTADSAVWLHIFPFAETVKRARDLLKAYPDASTRHPLFGIPFSIKDSIDIKGIPTTAACPAYAYVAENDSPSYAALIEAGCIAIGKVNLVCSLFVRSPLPCLNFSYNRINWVRLLHDYAPSSNHYFSHWFGGNAISIRPASVCILGGLRLWWLLFRFMRVSCLQSSLVLPSN